MPGGQALLYEYECNAVSDTDNDTDTQITYYLMFLRLCQFFSPLLLILGHFVLAFFSLQLLDGFLPVLHTFNHAADNFKLP